MILYTLNATALALGAYNLKSRMAGLSCGCCVHSLMLSTIIVIACFRFNTIGKLSALSKAPAAYNEDGNSTNLIFTNDDRVYGDDATLITWLWSLMMVFWCCKCCINGYIMKPPSGEQMMAATAGMQQQYEQMQHA